MNRSIKLSLYPIIAILLYAFCVVKLSYIDNLNNISLIICFIIFIYLVLKGAVLKNKAYKSINVWLYIFCFFALFSSLINFKNIDGTFLFLLKVIDLVLFIEYTNEIEKGENLSKYFFLTSLSLGIIAITYANTHPYSVWKNDMNFLIGTKFTVSYNMIGSIIFYLHGFQKFKKGIIYKSILILLFSFSIYTCITANCTTGILGNIVLIISLIIKNGAKEKNNKINLFLKSNTAIIIIILETLLVFLLEKIIINVPIITYLVTNVFERSSNLSGRTIIYERILFYLKNHFLFGYGYNNVYDLFKNTMQIGSNIYAYNTQNALLEYLMYFGITGSSFFLIFIKSCFNRLKKIKDEVTNNDKRYYIIGFYVLVFMGIVEPTFNFFFLIFVTSIACGKLKNNNLSNNKQKH